MPDQSSPPASSKNVVIRVGKYSYTMSPSVVRTHNFQHSLLNALITRNTLPDGTTVQVSNSGEIILQPTTIDPIEFGLIVDHLHNRNPLASHGIVEVCGAFSKLKEGLERWKLPIVISIPPKLWTATRWSDLTGFYLSSSKERDHLNMRPVALQMDDYSLCPVYLCKPIVADEMTATVAEVFENPLDQQKVIQAYRCFALKISLFLVNCHRRLGGSGETECLDKSVLPTSPLTTTALDSATSEATDLISDDQATCIVLSFDANSGRPLVYELPKHQRLPPLKCPPFPFFYRRNDATYLRLSVGFGLEIEQVRDSLSQVVKLKATMVGRQGGTDAKGTSSAATVAAPVNRSDSANSAVTVTNWLNSVLYPPKRENWCCIHPNITGIKYASNFKWTKEFGDVKCIRFYRWGALFVNRNVDSPFATLAIEEELSKQIYGKSIQVFVRGYPSNLFSRRDIDIAVSANLETVYLLVGGQLVSQEISPTCSRVDFEISASNSGSVKVKGAHVDICDGCPLGANLKDLYCLGVIAEFETSTALFHQNKVGGMLCERFKILFEEASKEACNASQA